MDVDDRNLKLLQTWQFMSTLCKSSGPLDRFLNFSNGNEQQQRHYKPNVCEKVKNFKIQSNFRVCMIAESKLSRWVCDVHLKLAALRHHDVCNAAGVGTIHPLRPGTFSLTLRGPQTDFWKRAESKHHPRTRRFLHQLACLVENRVSHVR